MNRKRRILALDGGGIKGVLAAAFLETVEDATGKRIADHFDLIAGTSAGGIIALGLGLGMSAREIVQFYVNDGPRIFDQPNLLDQSQSGRLSSMWAKVKGAKRQARQVGFPKYDSLELRLALERAFKSARLGDSRVRLVVPAYNAGRVHLLGQRCCCRDIRRQFHAISVISPASQLASFLLIVSR